MEELSYLVAKALGWQFFWSKHNYWRVTDHEGREHSCFEHWKPYDSESGRKNNLPTEADCVIDIGFYPHTDDEFVLQIMNDNLIGVRPNSEASGWIASDYQDSSSHVYANGDEIGEAVMMCFVKLKDATMQSKDLSHNDH